jgi:hypothetical protein
MRKHKTAITSMFDLWVLYKNILFSVPLFRCTFCVFTTAAAVLELDMVWLL